VKEKGRGGGLPGRAALGCTWSILGQCYRHRDRKNLRRQSGKSLLRKYIYQREGSRVQEKKENTRSKRRKGRKEKKKKIGKRYGKKIMIACAQVRNRMKSAPHNFFLYFILCWVISWLETPNFMAQYILPFVGMILKITIDFSKIAQSSQKFGKNYKIFDMALLLGEKKAAKFRNWKYLR
jgi:hypothetical protein